MLIIQSHSYLIVSMLLGSYLYPFLMQCKCCMKMEAKIKCRTCNKIDNIQLSFFGLGKLENMNHVIYSI
uniref:Uncharacterized protein n=1 Tax=Pararge aegeria TaxID=116150 RepID=S4PX38_9NEOP